MSKFPNLIDVIQHISAQYPDKICLQMWHDDHISASFTYAQMISEIEKQAKLLRKIGVQAGDRVGIMAHNCLEWVIAFFALVHCKATAVAIDSRLDGADFASFIQGTDPRIVLTSPSLFNEIPQTALKSLPSFYNIHESYNPIHLNENSIPLNEDRDETIALIVFTSGSTGTPKGILLDHKALITVIETTQGYILAEDRFIAILPLSHIMGLGTSVLMALGRGCTVTMINEIKSEIILRSLEATRSTVFVLVPRLLEIFHLKIFEKINALPPFARKAIRSLISFSGFIRRAIGLNLGPFLFPKIHQGFGGKLRLFFFGGAALDPVIWKEMEDLGFVIIGGYGLSETAGAVTGSLPKKITFETSGKPFASTQIKIDPKEGEICIKGDSLFRGYFRNSAATENAFQEGWFHTGDLGHLTAKGELVITGRIKELIVLQSGQKAIPNEVDRYYSGIEGIEEFASFGVPVSPGATSDRIHAAVVISKPLKESREAREKIEERIRQRSNSVPTHLRVACIHIEEELPKTRALKIKRTELRKKYTGVAEQNQIRRPNVVSEIQTSIERHVRQLLNLAPDIHLDETKGLFELGIDSLLATELVTRLQEEYGAGVNLSPTAAFEHPNIQAMTKYLKGLLSRDKPEIKTDLPKEGNENGFAIVGMACRFPGGANDLDAFWQTLHNGIDASSEVPKDRWLIDEYYDPRPQQEGKMYCRKGGFLNVPIAEFDASFFAISPREAEIMDPQQRLLLEVTWEALENGGIDPKTLYGTKTGVFIGASTHDYADLIVEHADIDQVNAYWSTGNSASVLAGRISYFLGVQGPSMSIDTACSSSLVALDAACKSLLLGESNMALAGGVNLMLSPLPTLICCQAKMLSADGICKTFDANANGYSRGEGCGVVLIKRLSDALKDNDRIYAVIHATKVNQDGASAGLTVPNGEAQASLIAEALKAGHLKGSDIDYLEAHGTGTSLGDPIEVRAASAVLASESRDQIPLLIGSVKTNIGHLESAAGIAGLIKVALSLFHGEIPPHLHLQTLNPMISLKEGSFPLKPIPWQSQVGRIRYAGINSFGFSGTNAHAIVKEAPLQQKFSNETERPQHLLVLSAKTEKALLELVRAYQKVSKEIPLSDIAYTANTGRAHFNHRLAVIAQTTEELVQKLQSGHYLKVSLEPGKRKKIAFVFTDQGSESIGMEKELYETQPVFRKAIDQCRAILAPLMDQPLTNRTPPFLFALQYSLAAVWESWGIVPDCVIGHGAGRYVADVVAGSLTLEDGLKAMLSQHPREPLREPQNCDISIEMGPDCSWTTLLENLSKLYTYGVEIDWKGFDAPYHRQKISLPTYPFQRERFWADSILNQKKKKKQTSICHALLGEKKCLPKQEVYYETDDLPPFLKDHVILEHPIFPGAGYIEMIFAAGKQHYKSSCLAIENLILSERFDLKGNNLLTQTSLQAEWLKVSIYSPLDEEWKEHASATVKTAQNKTDFVSIEALKNSCLEEIDPRDFYQKLAKQGIQYGPLFQTIVSLRKGKSCAFAKVRVETSIEGYLIHPALLDGAFQVFGAALLGEALSDQELYLPCGVEQFDLTEPAGAALFVFGKIHADLDKLPEIVSMDLELFSLEGKKIGNIQGFKTKRIRRSFFTTVNPIERLLYQAIWEPKALPLAEKTLPSEGPWILIGEEKKHLQATVLQISELLNGIRQNKPKGILYFCKSVEELLLLMQELIRIPVSDLCPIWFISMGNSLELSPITGMCKTFSMENPWIQSTHLIFDASLTEEENYALLSEELKTSNPDKEEILYFGKKRHVLRLLKRADAAKSLAKLIAPKSPSYQLQVSQKGSFNNLVLERIFLNQKLQGHEVAIQVKATGLNFRDVLNALGLYPGDPGALGGECSGIITAVGPDVKNLQVGDEVFGFASGSFATDVVSDERILIRKPKSVTFSEAAGLPIVFCTAYYGLVRLANLKKGQRILIHAASGGVGLAAIQIAKLLGAEIYATASTPAKRELLKSLGAVRVYDSRSLDFADQMNQDGEGVDVVLNSLSGEGFIAKTVSCCKKNGVFLEIGKRNIWTQEEMRPDLRYFIIALDEMVAKQPELIQSLMQEVFSQPELKPLPITAFALNDAISAFQYMSQAKHIGKIVIERNQGFTIDPRGSYLITGGGGALGLETAKWLASKGARHLCLVGRNILKNENDSPLAQQGVKIERVSVDMAKEDDVVALIRRFGKDLPLLKGVFHAAGVLDDAMIAEQTLDRFEKVMAPKARGAWYLHEATKELNLDCFVLYSSIASVIGSPGQLNYAAANSYLDSLSSFRQSLKLPAISVNWGPWGQIGMAAGLENRHKANGLNPLQPQEALAALEICLADNTSQMTIVDADWSLSQYKSPILSSLVMQKDEPQFHLKLANHLRNAKPSEKKQIIHSHIQELVRHIIGLRPDAPLNEKQNFYELGLDSLMSVELRNYLQDSIDKTIPLSPTIIMDNPTIELLSTHLAKKLIDDQIESIEKPISTANLFIELKKSEKTNIELACFPYAGGGPWIFSKWGQALPPEIGLKLFQMPGRGARQAEAPIQKLEELIYSIADSLGNESQPFALFGHSMGSLVSYAVAAELQRRKKAMPVALFVSSLDAPSTQSITWPNDPLISLLEKEHDQSYKSDDQMKEILKMYATILRNDLRLMAEYRFKQTEPLSCPIFAYYGVEDGVCSEKGLNAWAHLTSSQFTKVQMPGNHFDLIVHAKQLLFNLCNSLKDLKR